MAPITKRQVALITCSTRQPRVGPSVTSWISPLITMHLPPDVTLKFIDLASISLPISPVGPGIPAGLPQPLAESPYLDDKVNAWSHEIRACHGFVFVTPQYNWSYPAAVKIALDHLFYEWKGKPALIVSYGGRGGGKANDALRGVLNGLRMSVCEARVELPFGKGVAQAEKGVLDDAIVKTWEQDGKSEDVAKGWKELIAFFENQA